MTGNKTKIKMLWDYEHPYYMAEGCYFSRDCFHSYDSWADFLEAWKDYDIDLNRVHRWDFDEDKTAIQIFYVIQRKGYTSSCYVKIKPEDHDDIKKFLKPHAKLNAKLWAGVL